MPAAAMMLSGAAVGGGGFAFATLTIDKTKCGSGNTTDYPLLFAGTYAFLKGVGSGGTLTSVNNVAFYSDAGLTTLLDFERVFHDLTTGTVEYHIRVPTLSVSVDTVIYPDVDTSNMSDLSDPTNVWDSGFKGVYHFDPSSVVLTDSTSHANHGTLGGLSLAATTGAFGGGTLGGGLDQGNGTGYVELGTDASLSLTGDATIEAWQKALALSPVDVNFIFCTGNNAGDIQFAMEWNRTANKVTSIWGGGGGFDIKVSSASITTAWQRWTQTREGASGASGSGIRHYINGVLDANSPYTGSHTPGSFNKAYIGAWVPSGFQRNNSIVDEIRVSSVVRSASYETATYNNHSSPSTFYALA